MRPITFAPTTTPNSTQASTTLTLDRSAATRALTTLDYTGPTGSADPQQVLDRITTALEANSGHVELYLLRRVAERCKAQGHALTWRPEPSTGAELLAQLHTAQRALAALTARGVSNTEMAAAHRRVADAHQALADHEPRTVPARSPFGPGQPAQRAAWPLATGQPTL